MDTSKKQTEGGTNLAEGLMGVPAEHVCAGRHFLLAHQEALVVALVPLPRQPPLQQEEEGVCQGLEIVSP